MKKTIQFVITLLALSINTICQAQPIGNYGAHLGKYGLERYLTERADYVKYIGQKVVVLQMDNEGIGAEYEIKKLVGGIDFMTITLENCVTNNKIKFSFSVSGESNTDFYITDETTIPLLLLDTFNQDKQVFIGKHYPIGSDEGNSLGIISDFVLHCYNKGFPLPSFKITRSDSSIEFIPFDGEAYITPNVELLSSKICSAYHVGSSLTIEDDGTITFNKVITADNKTKDDLFLLAMDFVVSEYKNAQKVIQFSDQEAGVIIGKGLYEINKNCHVHHTLKIECKNGRIRIRYSLENYSFGEIQEPITLRSPFVGDNNYYNSLFTSIVSRVNYSILEIEKKIQAGTSKIDSEDW